MCAEAKTNRVFLVSPFSIRQSSCGMRSGDACGIVQCNLGIFDNFRLLSIKNGGASRNVVQRYMLSIRPRYGAVIAAGEGHALYWTSLTQVNRFRRERDIYSPVKHLSFLKMTPCLDTGEQHKQISVKLLIIQCINAELIGKDYGIHIFSFLNSVFQNCPEK